MKILIGDQELIKNQKKAQNTCIKFLGNGNWTVEELQDMVETLKKTNSQLIENCKTRVKIKVISCGGTCNIEEVPLITQSELYLSNQKLISALLFNINIAKSNNIQVVDNFNFTDKEILRGLKQF